MKIIERYIMRSVLSGVTVALLIIIALAAIFSLIEEFSDIRGGYSYFEVFKYVLLTLPRRAYELFPMIVLIGSLFGLGNLATHNELIVIRATGISIRRISIAVLQAGLILMLFAVVLGELVAPVLEQNAQIMRSKAQTQNKQTKTGYIHLKGRYGFWARDGDNFINIRRVIDETNIEDVLVYRFGIRRRLAKVMHAEKAEYKDDKWHLYNVRQSQLKVDSVEIKKTGYMVLPRLIDPEILPVLAVKPENLSVFSLYKLVRHLAERKQHSKRYELAVWVKLFAPFSTLVMLLLAIPFIFRTLRVGNAGQRLLFGVLLGLGFYMVNQGFNQLGVVYGLPPALSAGLPSLLFAAAGLYAIRRIE